jgi:molybdopterin-guanine dinucleotide biosynthesis protein A
MISNDHKKHHQMFQFHANEIGIWGIGCSALALLYESLKSTNPNQKIGYYDVKHKPENNEQEVNLNFNNIELKINQRIESHQISQFFNNADLLIVNGNHAVASKMILMLDGKKEFKPNETHLINTIALFYNEKTEKLAWQLHEANPKIELIVGTDHITINAFLNKFIESIKPVLSGLILTGGESSRMKQNKSLLVYHQEAQWFHLYKMLENKCNKTYISCTEKSAHLYNSYPVITDSLIGFGPLSGILSALLNLKNKAILVLACDLPLINLETIQQLIEERDQTKMATVFFNSETKFLEPLIAIYEPKALALMLAMLGQGYTCPRKMLLQNDIKTIKPKNPLTLKNVNFPDEKLQIEEMLKKL